MKKVLVTGSRYWKSDEQIEKIYFELKNVTNSLQCEASEIVIVHGACEGVDTIADEVSKSLGYNTIPYQVSQDDWKKFKLAAGPIRNQRMFDEQKPFDLILAFHDDIENSKGTKNMISIVKKSMCKVQIKIIK